MAEAMTRLEVWRRVLDQPVDGDQQPGRRVLYAKADPRKVRLRNFRLLLRHRRAVCDLRALASVVGG